MTVSAQRSASAPLNSTLNGTIVGSGLLNGRNLLLYLETVWRLLTIEDIGQMDRMCFKNGVDVAETAVGWGHCYELLDLAAKEAESYIVEDETFI